MQIQQWNDEVLEFLASLYLEDMSEEEALANLRKIEDFEDDVEDGKLDTVTELANSLPTEKRFKKVVKTLKEK